jgi:hypothetical protein
MDDEHFTVAMAAEAYPENPAAVQVWQSTIRPMLRRSSGFRTMLSQGIVPGPVRTPAGIVLPNRRAINFSAPRIGRVVERIVRGLLWHHYRILTTASTEILVYRGQDVPFEVAQIINTSTTSSWIGGSIFQYRHGVARDGRDSSIWALQFYTRADFIAIVKGDSFMNAERTQTLGDGGSEED